MKQIFTFLMFLEIFIAPNLWAATIECAGSGDWGASGTWVGGVVPNFNDDVNINSTYTVFLTDNFVCHNLSVLGGLSIENMGNLSITGNLHKGENQTKLIYLGENANLSIAGNLLLEGQMEVNNLFSINGNITIPVGGQLALYGEETFNFGTGFNCAGTIITLQATANFNNGSVVSGKMLLTGENNISQINVNAGAIINADSIWLDTKFVDNIGISANFLCILEGAIFDGSQNQTINSLYWHDRPTAGADSFIRGAGTMIVNNNFFVSGIVPNLQGDKIIKFKGTNSSINTLVRLEDNSSIIVESGAILNIGISAINDFYSTGFYGSASTVLDIKSGGTINFFNNFISPGYIYTHLVSNGNIVINGFVSFQSDGFGLDFDNSTINLNPNSKLTITAVNSGAANLNNTNVLGNGTLDLSTIYPYFSIMNVNANSTISSNIILKRGILNDNVGITPKLVELIGSSDYSGTGSPTFTTGLIVTDDSGIPQFSESGIVTVNGYVKGTGILSVNNTKEVRFNGINNSTQVINSIYLYNTTKLTFGSSSIINTNGSIGGSSTSSFDLKSGGTWNIKGTGYSGVAVPATILGTINVTKPLFSFSGDNIIHTFNGAILTIASDCRLQLGGTPSGVVLLNLIGTTVSGLGILEAYGANVTANIETGTTVTSKLSVTYSAKLNDNVGLSPGEVTLGIGGYPFSEYGGTGNPFFANGFSWTAGNFNGSGLVTISNSMSLISTFNKFIKGNKQISIAGTASVNCSSLSIENNGKIIIQNGGIINHIAGSIFASNVNTFVEIKNGGIFNRNGVGIYNAPIKQLAGGILNIISGQLDLVTYGTSSSFFYKGIINISSGATAKFIDHNCYFQGTTLNNNGTILIGSGFELIIYDNSVVKTLGGSGGTFSSLTLGGGGNLTISGSQTITGALKFSGGLIKLENGNLTVGSIIGGGTNGYVATLGTGQLKMQVSTLGLLFPIGTSVSSGSYNPITISQSSGSDTYGVRVKVGFDYTTGGSDFVNRQWNIDRTLTNSTPATVGFSWETPAHISGSFNPNLCHVSRWNGSTWQIFGDASAVCVSSICTRTQNNITSFSPFGVASGTSLPIELLNFTAYTIKSTTQLNWQTASEHNNKGFKIERSPDAIQWTSLGFVAGKGDSQENNDYNYMDNQPFRGLNYYRLVQQDFDGKEDISSIVQVNFKEKAGSFSLYPNPVAVGQRWTIETDLQEEEVASLRLMDVTGRLVATFADLYSLETTNLTAGVYWLEMKSVYGVLVEKVVVE
jgi:hypothetical protein